MQDLAKRIGDLSPEQRKMLEDRLGKKKSRILNKIERMNSGNYSPIQPGEKREYYPVSPQQERLYWLSQLKGAGATYNTYFANTIVGDLDKEKIEEVFIKLIERHETFRTSYEVLGGEVVQRIHEDFDFEVDYFVENDKIQIDKIIDNYKTPFDLSKTPLITVCAVKTGDKTHIVACNIHDLVSDEKATEIVVDDMLKIYNRRDLPSVNLHYKDFVLWQREYFKTDDFKRQEEYWLNSYKEGTDRLKLPLDFPRPEKQTFDGKDIKFRSSVETIHRMKGIARNNNVTLNAALTLAYAILLRKFTELDEVVIGVQIEGKHHADLKDMLGFFVNVLPVRYRLEKEKTFTELLKSSSETYLEVLDNQDYPLYLLEKKLQRINENFWDQLCNTMVIYHSQDPVFENVPEHSASKYFLKRKDKKISTFDFQLDFIINSSGEIIFELVYNTNLFKAETMKGLSDQFLKLLDLITLNPDKTVIELEERM